MKDFNPRSQLQSDHERANNSSVDQSIVRGSKFWLQGHIDEEDDCEEQEGNSQVVLSADSLDYERSMSTRDAELSEGDKQPGTEDSDPSYSIAFSDSVRSSFYPPSLPTQSGQGSPISSASRSLLDSYESDHSYRLSHARAREDRRRQGRLLLVSLLENFCAVYGQSPERNRKLFFTICRMLSAMGVIEEEFVDEMSIVRSAYQRTFRDLFLTAVDSIRQEQAISGSPLLITPAPVSGSSMNNLSGSFSDSYFPDSRLIPASSRSSSGTATPTGAWPSTLTLEHMLNVEESRYLTDFAELGMIGRGGFASVWRARNKLDEIEYAVKKVRLTGADFMEAKTGGGGHDKIFREIKGLARLEHSNVVRYYGSWLEYVPKATDRRGLEYGSHVITVDTVTRSEEMNGKGFSDSLAYPDVEIMDDGLMVMDGPCFEFSDDVRRSAELDSHLGVKFVEDEDLEVIDAEDPSDANMPQGIPVKAERARSLAARNGSTSGRDSRAPLSSSPSTASGSPGKKMLSTSLEDGVDEDEVEEIRRRDNAFLPTDNNGWAGPVREPRSLTLFIQMQLCPSTLLDYIASRHAKHARRSGDEIDVHVNLRLFRGVVRGVAYIHDQGLIHRDLKPSNIFLSVVPDNIIADGDDAEASENLRWEAAARHNEKVTAAFVAENLNRIVPKIGDFGLVTNMDQELVDAEEQEIMVAEVQSWRTANALPSSGEKCACNGSVRCQYGECCPMPNEKPRSSTRTSGVGTVTYASPEQLANSPRLYNEKSDVYSLGIILFELFHPFATAMERAQALRGLRQGVLPERFVQRWPKESALVLWMMADDPEQRPSAKQLLEIELLAAPDKYTEMDVHARLREKTRALDAKTKEAEQLKKRVEELEKRLEGIKVDGVCEA